MLTLNKIQHLNTKNFQYRIFTNEFFDSLGSACKNTLCQIRKYQVRGLPSQKKRSLLFVIEHFFDEHNEEIGVFLLTLGTKLFTEIKWMETSKLVQAFKQQINNLQILGYE